MSEYRVLVVEDDGSVRSLINTALELQGYQCCIARKGTTALCLLTSGDIDVVLLDLGLPDIDGIDLIRQVRAWSSVPIIIISARNEDKDKIEALDAGADDYLTKPFSVDELLARLRSMLRRIAYLDTIGQLPPAEFKNGDLAIDFSAKSVSMKGEELHLTPIEYKLLAVLASNVGRVLTYSAILKAVWETPLETDIASLRVFMVSLRKKIEADPRAPIYINTHVGIGYRMSRVD